MKKEEIVKKYNEIYGQKVNTIEELLETLTEEFVKDYKLCGDIQMAFNLLFEENESFMKNYCFVCSLTSNNGWKLKTGKDYNTNYEKQYIQNVRDVYQNNTTQTIKDVLDIITEDIENTMCNCDVGKFTALQIIMDNKFPQYKDVDIFEIICEEETPVIEILY